MIEQDDSWSCLWTVKHAHRFTCHFENVSSTRLVYEWVIWPIICFNVCKQVHSLCPELSICLSFGLFLRRDLRPIKLFIDHKVGRKLSFRGTFWRLQAIIRTKPVFYDLWSNLQPVEQVHSYSRQFLFKGIFDIFFIS